MKTIVPFCSIDELKELIDEDVDEYYCGVLEDDWVDNFSLSYSANKRAKRGNSLGSFDELKESFDLISSRDKDMYFIFNNFYVPSQKKFIDSMFDKVLDIGVKNYTVTDFYMVKKVKDSGMNPILSSTTPILNSRAAKFVKGLGVKKIILPRDLDIDEISRITSDVDLEYEVIIKNESCPNIDGLCRFFHGQKKDGSFVKHACVVDFDVKIKSSFSIIRKEDLFKRVIINVPKSKYSNYCGICYIKKLEDIGVRYLKIPSRGHDMVSKIRDVNFVRFGVDNTKKNLSFEDLKKEVRSEYIRVYGHDCSEKCYYS